MNKYLKIPKTLENTRNTRESMKYPEMLNQIFQISYLTRTHPLPDFLAVQDSSIGDLVTESVSQ